MNVHFVLVVIALVCELLAAVGVGSRVNLMALGLFCWMLAGVI